MNKMECPICNSTILINKSSEFKENKSIKIYINRKSYFSDYERQIELETLQRFDMT